MITIIHGDDVVLSRNYFIQLKKEHKDPVSFQTEECSLTDLMQASLGGGLFGSTKSIFIEDFFSKKKSADYQKFISFFNTHRLSDIILWEGKQLSKKTLSEIPKASIKQFQIPKIIFTFLDAIMPGNTQVITYFHQILKQVEVEFILFMLIRQFRLLLALSDSSKDPIEEVKRLSFWQISKLQKQGLSFSTPFLKQLYKKLHLIDKESKTGTANTSLVIALDLLLLDIIHGYEYSS